MQIPVVEMDAFQKCERICNLRIKNSYPYLLRQTVGNIYVCFNHPAEILGIEVVDKVQGLTISTECGLACKRGHNFPGSASCPIGLQHGAKNSWSHMPRSAGMVKPEFLSVYSHVRAVLIILGIYCRSQVNGFPPTGGSYV